MGDATGIAWTDSTFNPWWGCQRVSPGCVNCYAESWDARFPGTDGPHWGPSATRRFFGDKHWNQPVKWNQAAVASGRRRKVFCASMADVFEDRPDLVDQRIRLWKLIEATPMLDWLLLTKRPENISRMMPAHRLDFDTGGYRPYFDNVWLGTTVESQEWADRLEYLLSNPAVVHFVSAEPLLGLLDLTPWMRRECPETGNCVDSISWVITGCESGKGARPQNVHWFRDLRDQCEENGVAFFLKQAEPLVALPRNPGMGVPTTIVGTGPGSWIKAREGIIEQPYLDGVQHVAFPRPRTYR